MNCDHPDWWYWLGELILVWFGFILGTRGYSHETAREEAVKPPASALIAYYAAKFGITKWAAELILTANHRRSVEDGLKKENA